MDADFLQWLYQEAVEGRWDQAMVFKALKKEEVDGKTVIVAHLPKALELTSVGPAGIHQGDTVGRYELVPGEEQEGSPVYRQTHSREIPSPFNHRLYRLGDEWLVGTTGMEAFLKARGKEN